MDADNQDKQQTPAASPSFLSVMMSALAAAVGVQSGRNQARDFSRGKAGHYILAGIIFTVVFVVSLVVVVRLVLSKSGL